MRSECTDDFEEGFENNVAYALMLDARIDLTYAKMVREGVVGCGWERMRIVRWVKRIGMILRA